MRRHLFFQFHIPVGNNDGIVDVCPHLYGADHQITKEEQIAVHQIREGEVDPYTPLNNQYQQNRQPHRLECKEQYQNDKYNGKDTDHHIIPTEGAGKVKVTGAVAYQQKIVIIYSNILPKYIQELSLIHI